MNEQTHFSTDVGVEGALREGSGVTVDEDGTTIDFDEVETRVVEDVPYEAQFDTDEFHVLRTTVARPIPQPYQFDDSIIWMQKPRSELKKAAWSLDNAPWTLGHPETNVVKDSTDIEGFWRNPTYDEDEDRLDADLYVPVQNDEAKAYLMEHGDVSVGFYNRMTDVDAFDGEVGHVDTESFDTDEMTIDAYQTNMLFDHVASVDTGRCSGAEGCGFEATGDEHGTAAHGHTSEVAVGDADRRNDPWIQFDSRYGNFYGQVTDSKADGCFGNLDGDRQIVCAESEENPVFLIRVYDVDTEQFTDIKVGRLMGETTRWHGPRLEGEDRSQGDLSALKGTDVQQPEQIQTQRRHVEEPSYHKQTNVTVMDEYPILSQVFGEDALSSVMSREEMSSEQSMEQRSILDVEEGGWYKYTTSRGIVRGQASSIVTDGCTSEGVEGGSEMCATKNNPVVVIDVYDVENDEFMTQDGERVKDAQMASKLNEWAKPSADSCGGECGCGLHTTLQATDGSVSNSILDDVLSPALTDESLTTQSDGSQSILSISDSTGSNVEDLYISESEDSQNDSGVLHPYITELDEAQEGTEKLFTADAISVHDVSYDGTTEGEWNEPNLEDFTEESWEDMSSDEQSSVAAHFLVSKGGFPPENFSDLALPVVTAEGNLSLNALQNAKARASQVSGLSGDTLSRVESKINSLAENNFEDAEFSEDGFETMTMDINLDDLSAEAVLSKVADEHDGVAEYLDSIEEQTDKASEAEDAAEEMDLDSVEELTDAVSMLVEQKTELEAEIDSLEEKLSEMQRPEMEEDAEYIAEQTDRFGETAEEVLEQFDEDAETIADKRELVEDLTGSFDEQTANADRSGGQTGPSVQSSGKYARQPEGW